MQVHPRVSSQLLGAEAGRPLLELEQEVGKHFHFEGSEGLPLDWFELVDTGSRDEIEQRALPFREGEELLVQIEEPHMYDEDAAVGKIDSYVISVAGAGRLIGEERLVRITEVGRTSASAEIVGGAPARRRGDDGRRQAAAAARPPRRARPEEGVGFQDRLRASGGSDGPPSLPCTQSSESATSTRTSSTRRLACSWRVR